jgi:hypothetical protein
MKSMPDIFISYSSKDYDFVREFANDLRKRHLLVWLDKFKRAEEGEGIPPGSDWVNAIEKGIHDSAAVVVVLSPDAVASAWVRKEMELARQNGKPLFIYRYRDVDPMPPELGCIQQVVHGTPEAMNSLVNSLRQLPAIWDNTLADMLKNLKPHERNTYTFEVAANRVRGSFRDRFTLKPADPVVELVALPFVATDYCRVYLVGRADDTLEWLPKVQIGMQMTREYPNDAFYKEIAATFFATDPKFRLRLLLIRGPRVYNAQEQRLDYALDPEEEGEWRDGLNALNRALEAYEANPGRPALQIFALTPAVLMYEWGRRNGSFTHYELYHYIRERDTDRYVRVLG